jgi:hypothetical protein
LALGGRTDERSDVVEEGKKGLVSLLVGRTLLRVLMR